MRISDIWDEMMTLERRMDDLFSGIRPRASAALPSGATAAERRPFVPACDVYRSNGELVVEVAMPGIDPKKDVEVTIQNGDLVIRGERRHREEISEENVYRLESSFGSFERWIPLPEGTKEKDIKAEYHDGLLEIHVPAKPKGSAPPKPKAIPIKTTEKKRSA